MNLQHCFCTILFIIYLEYCKGSEECERKLEHLAPVRLKNDLLCGYEKTIRPVINQSNSTVVTVRMVLKFFTYEVHSNTLSIHNWLAMYWKDEHLKWEPSKYDGIKQVHLSSEDIWVPDISIYNRNDQSGSPSAFTSIYCLVSYNGVVACVPPARHDALCMPDLTNYPYDRQNCSLRYGSWMHSGEELNFKIPPIPVTVDDYTPNGLWNLLRVNVTRNPGHFNCCPDNTYPSLTYSFLIERHSATFAVVVVIPALVLAVLTLMTLWLTPEQLDRLCLAGCNLIAHFMYMQLLFWELPATGENSPLLLLFARDSLLLCAFTVVLTTILRSMIKTDMISPRWISVLVSLVQNNRPGNFLLLYNSNIKSVITGKTEDDTSNIISDSTIPASHTKDWQLFAKVLDRLSFGIYIIVYFCIFIKFVL